MRELKFKTESGEIIFPFGINHQHNYRQYTGLLDKNGLKEIYEGDIINSNGEIIGNLYENEDLFKGKTYFLVEGLGTKKWKDTESTLNKLGCFYAK